ncbi:MAG: hypothetical protein U0871_00185 [Gemmataceae bacterium]
MPRYTQWLIPPVTAVVLAAVLSGGQPTPSPSDQTDVAPTVTVDPTMDLLRCRSLVRDRLAREVAEGNRSVFEAAALFEALDQLHPPLDVPRADLGVNLPVPFPANTAAELRCRHVALWVYLATKEASPDHAVQSVARLADEVREEVRVNGAVRLPGLAELESPEQLVAAARAEYLDPPKSE